MKFLASDFYLKLLFSLSSNLKLVVTGLLMVLHIYHYGLLDSYFFQATSISYSGFPWVSGSPGGPTELDFKGSGCDHEVLGVLESKNLKMRLEIVK